MFRTAFSFLIANATRRERIKNALQHWQSKPVPVQND